MILSVLKALDILTVFQPDEPALSLSQISRRAGLPKSTAHNLLNTMAARGFIEKLPDDNYALGTALISLTQAVYVNAHLRDRAAPLLRALADDTNESVYLTYLDGDFVLYIYAIETSGRLLARSAVGDRAHLHATSVGKAILAALPAEAVDGIIERAGLPRFTEFTLADRDSLHAELDRTRARGYSMDNQEHERDTYCLGAVIRDDRGEPIGACSISGRDPAIIGSRAPHLSTRTLETAQEISRRMGYVPSAVSQLSPHSYSSVLQPPNTKIRRSRA